jgi:hypothetical protein
MKTNKFLLILAGILLLQTAKINAQDRPSRAAGTMPGYEHVNAVNKIPAGSIKVNRNDTYVDKSPEYLVKNIFLNNDASATVTIVRVVAEGLNTSGTGWTNPNIYDAARGLAYFNKGGSNFPIAEGLFMCTGNTLEAEGINNFENSLATSSIRGAGDADLMTLIDRSAYPADAPPKYIIYNATILEFDFVPSAYSIQFEYIFASEEYPSFVNTKYNDVFGFWVEDLSPSPTHKKVNIAKLPNGDVVSINTVNNGTWANNKYNTRPVFPGSGIYSDTIAHNKEYFNKNIGGSETIEFNGYTTVLKAALKGLNPRHTYRLKLAVANTGDQAYGSGVFLKANSMVFGNTLSVYTCGVKDATIVYKKSDNNFIRIVRPDIEKDEERKVALVYGNNINAGDAINGVDYMTTDGKILPDTILFEIGEDTVDIPFIIAENATVGRNIKVALAPLYVGAPPQTEHSVNINIATVDVDAGADIRQSNSNVFTMNASPSSGTWSVVGDADGVTITNTSAFNTTVTLDISKRKTATLRWTVTDGNCSYYDDVELNYGEVYLPVNPGVSFYKNQSSKK